MQNQDYPVDEEFKKWLWDHEEVRRQIWEMIEREEKAVKDHTADK